MPKERVRRRLAAILAADVVGYSRLMRADEAGTLAQIKNLRSEVLDPKVAEYNGRIVKTTGDGFLIEFPSVVDAVQHAVDVQRAMAQRNATVPEDRRMELRIGVNVGDVIVEGDDLYGDGVNLAARLETLAEPSGTCISGAAFDHVKDKLDIRFDDLGLQLVKNIAEPVRVYRVRDDGSAASETARAVLLARPAPRPDTHSIAVLPFENMSGDPEQEYFADGLTEDIIAALSVWRSFPVIARNSTFTYKGKAVRVQQIAGELGARYVLEGGVRKAGGKVRVTAQLIDARTGHHVWAQKFDRDLEDIFAVQDEITQRIATTVVPELEKIETRRSAAKQTHNLDAWDCYLRGLSFLHESTVDGNVRAREMFEHSIELDPNYGPAYSGVSYILNRELLLNYAESYEDMAARCLEAAERAVGLDEASGLTRLAVVRALLWCGQHDTAIAEARKALELNQYDALAHFWLGAALAFAGRYEEGVPYLETAIEFAPLDPRNTIFRTHLALADLSAGQPERALERLRAAARPQSDFIEAPLVLASVLAHVGKEKEARAVLDRVAVADLGAVERRPFWRRYRYPITKELVLEGLRKAGLPE